MPPLYTKVRMQTLRDRNGCFEFPSAEMQSKLVPHENLSQNSDQLCK